MERLFALTLLLLTLSVVCCSAKEEDGEPLFDHTEGELSRPKRSLRGYEHCSCPGLHTTQKLKGHQKQKRHKPECPCDNNNFPRPDHRHRHRHGKTQQHMYRQRQHCKKFLTRCSLKRIQFPL